MNLSDAIGLELERREDDYCPYPEECGAGIDGEMCHLPKVKALQARIQAAIEVYAGMDGFIPETAAEGYCLRIIEQMNEALQESDDERV